MKMNSSTGGPLLCLSPSSLYESRPTYGCGHTMDDFNEENEIEISNIKMSISFIF